MNQYQLAFFDAIKDLEAIDLDKICFHYGIPTSAFIGWVKSDLVLKAKWREVNEARASTKNIK